MPCSVLILPFEVTDSETAGKTHVMITTDIQENDVGAMMN